MPVAHEQCNPELVLQLPDMPAERRLGDVEPLGGSRDTGFLSHGEEGTQMAEIHGGRFYTRSVENRVIG